jgi:hypothetical protein
MLHFTPPGGANNYDTSQKLHRQLGANQQFVGIYTAWRYKKG